MVERQVLGMPVLTAVLAAVPVADVDPGPLHRGFAIVSANVNVVTQPDDRWHGEYCRRRMENIIAVVFFDKHGAAKPQADRTSDTHRAERLVRKIQK